VLLLGELGCYCSRSGGIPICFPQFGNLGPCAAQHGFARNSEWTLTSEVSPSATAITLTMESSEESLKVFPYEFAINFIVTLSDAGALITRMEVVNNGTSVMPFTCALHTYFATPDVSQVSIEGLMGTEYLDYMQDRKQMSQTENAVGFAKEVDCIYMDTPDTLKLHCSPTRTILLKKTGLPDAVVWNPWIAKAQAMGDFGDDEYKTMFCVEAALAKGSGAPVQLGGGMQWACEQELSVA